MGLHPDIKKEVKERFPAAVHAVKSTVWQKEQLYINPRRVAAIQDTLTVYQAMDKAETVTVHDIARRLWAKAEELVARPGTVCDIFVSAIDFSPNVPKLKEATQVERVAASVKTYQAQGLAEVVPYPNEASFDAETGKIVYVDESGATRKDYICLRRLGMTKRVRAKLWPMLHEYFIARMGWAVRGRVFYFDYDASGPWQFTTKDFKDVEVVHRTDLAHELGEADPAMMWWLKFLQRERLDVHLLTTDSDLLPLYLAYASRSVPVSRSTVWWVYDADTALDFSYLYEHMQSRLGVHPLLFVLVCIVSGTDFVKKSLTTNYINLANVLEAARGWSMPGDDQGWAEVFKSFIECIYNAEYNRKTVAKVPPGFRKPKIKLDRQALRQAFPEKARGVSFPSSQRLAQAADICAFNIVYWFQASEGVSWKKAAPHLL